MSFTIVSDSTTNPLRLPNSSSHSPPPVNPAPSPPTRELPLLLLGLCDNNNNCVAVHRAFCWASARPAGTGNPLSLFYHLQPIPLCLGWRWSITGIKAAINVLGSRGHRHHSHTRSIFSLFRLSPSPTQFWIQFKKGFIGRTNNTLFFKMSPCLLSFSISLSLSLFALCTSFAPSLSPASGISAEQEQGDGHQRGRLILNAECVVMHYKQIRSILEVKIHFCSQ